MKIKSNLITTLKTCIQDKHIIPKKFKIITKIKEFSVKLTDWINYKIIIMYTK